MSQRPRPLGRFRWWALGVTGALLVACGLFAAGVAPLPETHGVAAASLPTPGPSTSPPVAGTWSDALGIPTDATDEERLRIKLTYDMVTVPVDREADLRAVEGVEVVYSKTFGDTVYAVVASRDAAMVAASVPGAVVTPNEKITASVDQSPVPSWGLDAVDNTAAAGDDHYLYDSDGTGVTAYVVDSGVQSDHPDFGGRVDAAAGHDEVGDGRGTEDCNGHGTHVAGTIGSTTYGVAKKVRIVPVRVLGCGREGSYFDLLFGMIWIAEDNDSAQSVVNMSIGSPKADLVNAFAEDLVDAGFVVAVAAGNETQNACNTSPASAPKLITVGAFDSSRSLAWYSNFGPCVDILAPGSDITSTWPGSSTAVASGTSMASPHVAGLAARLLQLNPTWGPPQVQAALTSAAASGHISGLPAATVNLVAAVPGVPKIVTVAATPAADGFAIAWTTNAIGTFTAFTVAVTDTTTGRAFPVTVSALRSSTVFTDVQAGHTYAVAVAGTARMPDGTVVTTDTMTANGP